MVDLKYILFSFLNS